MELTNRKLATTVYLDNLQIEGLQILAKKTRISMASHIREGVNLILCREGLDEFTEAEAHKKKLLEMGERESYASMRGKISVPGREQLLMDAFERYLHVAQLVKRK